MKRSLKAFSENNSMIIRYVLPGKRNNVDCLDVLIDGVVNADRARLVGLFAQGTKCTGKNVPAPSGKDVTKGVISGKLPQMNTGRNVTYISAQYAQGQGSICVAEDLCDVMNLYFQKRSPPSVAHEIIESWHEVMRRVQQPLINIEELLTRANRECTVPGGYTAPLSSSSFKNLHVSDIVCLQAKLLGGLALAFSGRLAEEVTPATPNYFVASVPLIPGTYAVQKLVKLGVPIGKYSPAQMNRAQQRLGGEGHDSNARAV